MVLVANNMDGLYIKCKVQCMQWLNFSKSIAEKTVQSMLNGVVLIKWVGVLNKIKNKHEVSK
jgi:hypothetical protein